MKPDKKIQPLAFGWYGVPLGLIILAGLACAGYLGVSHYRNYTDLTYQSFCAISRTVNCDTVSQSSHAVLMFLPVAVWAMIGYLFYGALFLMGAMDKTKERGWSMLCTIGLFFCGYSAYLAGISSLVIGSYCIMCIALYGVNLLLVFYPWLILRRFGGRLPFLKALFLDIRLFSSGHPFRVFICAMAILTTGLIIFFPRYWEAGPTKINADIATGKTRDGAPWIGAEHPELTIVEYTDYMCFQCRKMHFFLRNLVAEHPGKLRLVHRHFPLDKAVNPIIKTDVHPGSAYLSRIAIYASIQDKFWEVNDYLYRYRPEASTIQLRDIARDTGLDISRLVAGIKDPKLNHHLKRDIYTGLNAGIDGTPSFVIDGVVHTAQIPPDILERLNR